HDLECRAALETESAHEVGHRSIHVGAAAGAKPVEIPEVLRFLVGRPLPAHDTSKPLLFNVLRILRRTFGTPNIPRNRAAGQPSWRPAHRPDVTAAIDRTS